MSTIELNTQAQTLTPARTSQDGRTLRSSIDLEATRIENRYIELEVSTSHQAGRGYSATVTRASIDGYSRRINLSFGGNGDTTRVDIQQPASSRFSRKTLATLHASVVARIENELSTWLAWAKNCNAHQN